MTNPISKAIVKAAVAMGYGKKSDYKGSSVADVLEKFAAIAKDKGGSGGDVLMVTDNDGTLDKTMGEIQDAYLAGKRVIISAGQIARDVIGVAPVALGRSGYSGAVETYNANSVTQNLTPEKYTVSSETEEAARNAYPSLVTQ